MSRKTLTARHEEWIPVGDRLPAADTRLGGRRSLSDSLLVTVACENGLRFVDTDRFDGYTHTWETFHGSGRTVTHWMPLPLPAH